MNEIHLEFLRSIENFVQPPVGYNIQNWANSVLPNDNNEYIDPELNCFFNRDQLFEYCANPFHNNLNTTLAILAWGGMRRNYARILLNNNWNELNQIITYLRNNDFQNRIDAYNSFYNLRNQGLLRGLGVAYYTKLICFLSPYLNGFIMDQWTSKSINLLFDNHNISLTNSWVNDNNNGEIYNNFCLNIIELANELNISPLDAESKIFSKGRGVGVWRNYVIENYN